MSNLLKVVSVLQADEATVAYGTVKKWMTDPDPETRGATFCLLVTPEHRRKVRPAPIPEEIADFSLNYLLECIAENPRGEWGLSRYEAAWELTSWFEEAWQNGDRALVGWLRDSLAETYVRSSNAAVRDCIITGTLEHILSSKDLAQFFQSWQEHEILAAAYNEALALSVGPLPRRPGSSER